MALAAWLKFREGFADVLALCGKVSGAFGVFRVVAKQVSVLLHVGAAPGGIGHDGIYVGLLEYIDRLLCEVHGGGFLSGVHEQRAAAGLRLRSDDFAPFGG